MKRATLVLAVVALLLGGVGWARGDYIPISGSGNSGTISTTPTATEAWGVDNAPGVHAWGIPPPGSGTSTVQWNGSTTETEFTVRFTNLPSGVTIFTGPDKGIFFEDTNGFNLWDHSISPDALSITFTAPAGTSLAPGDFFRVEVDFSGPLSSNGVAFTGAFDPQLAPTGVPEPSTLTLLGIGSLGLLGYGWRRRRQSA
jgi:hypothetical protein